MLCAVVIIVVWSGGVLCGAVQLPDIAVALETAGRCLNEGGRVVYLGSGTAGIVGVIGTLTPFR